MELSWCFEAHRLSQSSCISKFTPCMYLHRVQWSSLWTMAMDIGSTDEMKWDWVVDIQFPLVPLKKYYRSPSFVSQQMRLKRKMVSLMLNFYISRLSCLSNLPRNQEKWEGAVKWTGFSCYGDEIPFFVILIQKEMTRGATIPTLFCFCPRFTRVVTLKWLRHYVLYSLFLQYLPASLQPLHYDLEHCVVHFWRWKNKAS